MQDEGQVSPTTGVFDSLFSRFILFSIPIFSLWSREGMSEGMSCPIGENIQY